MAKTQLGKEELSTTTTSNGWTVVDLGWCTKYMRTGNTSQTLTATQFTYINPGIAFPSGCSWGDFIEATVSVNDQAVSASWCNSAGAAIYFTAQNHYGGSVGAILYWSITITKLK